MLRSPSPCFHMADLNKAGALAAGAVPPTRAPPVSAQLGVALQAAPQQRGVVQPQQGRLQEGQSGKSLLDFFRPSRER